MKTLLAPLAIAALLAAGCSKEKTCAADETNVNDTCYALKSDPKNCGAVSHACGADQGCSAGTCVDCAASNGACTADVVAACYNLNQVRPLGSELRPANIPLVTDSGPIGFARLGDKLYTANSTSNSISAISFAPPSATSGAASIKIPAGASSIVDLEHIAAHGGLLWVSNAGSGTLVVVDPAHGPVDEIALAASPTDFVNPQGIDFVGTKAYLALAGLDQVAVLDVSETPGVKLVTRIDVAPLASPGALAGPSRVVAVGSKVYVTLNDFFDASFQTVPDAHGRLAVIDASTDALVGGVVDLGADCLDASGAALSGSTLWVACGFFDAFGSKAISGAALVPVDVSGAAPAVGAPIHLQNAATSVAFCGAKGYAGASDTGTVIAFDPSTRAVTTALACPPEPGKASFVPALACAR